MCVCVWGRERMRERDRERDRLGVDHLRIGTIWGSRLKLLGSLAERAGKDHLRMAIRGCSKEKSRKRLRIIWGSGPSISRDGPLLIFPPIFLNIIGWDTQIILILRWSTPSLSHLFFTMRASPDGLLLHSVPVLLIIIRRDPQLFMILKWPSPYLSLLFLYHKSISSCSPQLSRPVFLIIIRRDPQIVLILRWSSPSLSLIFFSPGTQHRAYSELYRSL